MAEMLERLLGRLREVQDEIEEEIAKQREAFRFRIERGRVVFEEDIRARHRAARESLRSFLGRTRPMHVVTAPVIYALIVPLAFLDLCVTVFQWICFPAYGIERVRRRDYVVIDRQQLGYLNGLQKLNCVYCGYANGMIGYAREVASRTEEYWCPVKHSRRVPDPHSRYPSFLDFGDAEGFRRHIAEAEKPESGER